MKNRGFTLIELAVVLAVIAVLAGVLTPMVTGYIDQARTSRATADARSIADAIRLYQRDVGEFPIFLNAAEAASDDPSSTLLATGSGLTPSDGVGGGAWTTGLANTSLELYLNANYLGRTTAVSVGRTFFNGPYVGILDADPWGNKFYIAAGNLQDDSDKYGFVVSAGPDAVLNTSPTQLKTTVFVVGGDDIATVIK